MRLRSHCLRSAVLVAAGLVQVAAAQKFQEPTREELKMTSDPKAPGAAAVYLNLEESTDNRSHYVSRYARIKVLTELGKELATVEVPYLPGYSATPIIEARTIHADGTVVPLTGKAEDLLVQKSNKFHVRTSVFNLPSVEVGSILEYKWTVPMGGGHVTGINGGEGEEAYYSSALANSIPEWNVQQDLFVHKAHFYFNPFSDIESNVLGNTVTMFVDGERASYLLYTPRLPAGAHVQVSPKRDYSLDVQDVPAFRQEPEAPPESAFRYKVRFYYTPYATSKDYWENEIKRWSKTVEQTAGVSDAIRAMAAQIATGQTTSDAKARKLYEFVESLENTDFTRVKGEQERAREHLQLEIRNATDVLKEKSGTGNDLAILYLALARAAGLPADAVRVADREHRIFDPNYLALQQLDAMLVVLHLDGKDVYVDPGEKLCPFGQLHWSHTMAGGLQQGAAAPVYTPPNSTKDAITAHAAELTLDAAGNITGTVKILMNGPAAMYWRQLNLRTDQSELRLQFTEQMRRLLPSGLAAELAGFKGLETGDGYLEADLKVSGPMGTMTGKRIVLPGFFFSTGARAQFVADENREQAVDLHYAEQVIDDAIYRLPAGYAVESAPQPAQLPWPDHAALVVKTANAPGTLDVKHVFARAFAVLDPKEYSALRDYYGKVAANDQQQIVLAPPAGN